MDLQSGALFALTLGFLLGLKHATDADHVVAVSTIVSEYRNAWRGIWIGASWGLGHTTPLLVIGVVILVLKEAVLLVRGVISKREGTLNIVVSHAEPIAYNRPLPSAGHVDGSPGLPKAKNWG